MANFRNVVILLLLGFSLAVALSACGKRASKMDPPDDVATDTFPLVYPDSATDPLPRGVQPTPISTARP